MRRIVLLLAALAVIGGCAAEVVDVSNLPVSDERRGLAGHRYEARFEVGGRQIWITVGFGLDHVYASSECNDLTSGQWEVVDGRLVTGPDWSSTRRTCGNDRLGVDQWLYDFLSSGPLLTRNGDEVVLSDGSTVITLLDSAVFNRPLQNL